MINIMEYIEDTENISIENIFVENISIYDTDKIPYGPGVYVLKKESGKRYQTKSDEEKMELVDKIFKIPDDERMGEMKEIEQGENITSSMVGMIML